MREDQLMKTSMRIASAVLALVVAAGCNKVDKDKPEGPHTPSPPVQELVIEASILSAVLADDCKTAEAPTAAPRGDEPPDAKAAKSKRKMEMAKADQADDDIGAKGKRACQQSRVQLSLKSSAGDVPARIELVSVTLLDDKDGRELQQLVPRNPQRWDAATATYLPWDLTVSPSQELRTSFDLSAPDFDTIGGGSRWNTDGMNFRLTVALKVDGKDRSASFVLRSPFLTREPHVKT